MKISVIFSFRTELCFTVFFILLPALFPACSLKWINPGILLQTISWFFILLAGISNGFLTFTVWFPKAATAMMGFGAISHTFIIGRYLCCPVIATSRIDKYDGEMVTFHYNWHEDGQYMEETIPNSVVPFRSFNQWRTAILSSFGYDPLVCPDCQHRMNFWIWIIS